MFDADTLAEAIKMAMEDKDFEAKLAVLLLSRLEQDIRDGKLDGTASLMLQRLMADYKRVVKALEGVTADLNKDWRIKAGGEDGGPTPTGVLLAMIDRVNRVQTSVENFTLECTRLSIEERKAAASWASYGAQHASDDGIDYADWETVPIATRPHHKSVAHKQRKRLADYLLKNHISDHRMKVLGRYLNGSVPFKDVEEEWGGFSIPETLLDCPYFAECFPDHWQRLVADASLGTMPVGEAHFDPLMDISGDDLDAGFAKKSAEKGRKQRITTSAKKSKRKPETKRGKQAGTYPKPQTTRLGSGRFKGRPRARLVEDSLCFTLDMLRQRGLFNKREHQGQFVWTDEGSGQSFTVNYRWHNSANEQPELRLGYSVEVIDDTDALDDADLLFGEARTAPQSSKRSKIQRIQFTPKELPNGGVEWQFTCPETGACAKKLYLPALGDTFASKKGHGLKYASQYSKQRRVVPGAA